MTTEAVPVQLRIGRGLQTGDFRAIATGGFGDPANSYPHSMAWFGEHLYVGTTRNMFQLVKVAPDPSTDTFHLWPVYVPPGTNANTMDQRCQIWRYHPPTDAWEMVSESPRVQGTDGPVWRDFGYRTMLVHQMESDPEPALYVTTMSSSKAPGAYVLRSRDGRNFEPVTPRGLGDTTVSSFRAFVGFRDRLYVSPAGQGRLWAIAGAPVVLECRDLEKGWHTASPVSFGDPDNLGVFEMAVFNDHLYAGVANAKTGFQIWKTRAEGEPPYEWTRVIEHGAYRGPLNQAVMSMCAFRDALYVGSGIRRGGYDREFNIGPAAGELIRIRADDSWDLVAGTARFTPDGPKQPLSALGPGLGNPFAGYIWVMAEHDGHLYLGTYDSSVFLAFVDPRRIPPERNFLIRQLGVENILEREAGGDLWRSRDGANWVEITRTGFGNAYNYGVRTLFGGRPEGLFVGLANPFGPIVATKTAIGWQYIPNPDGGCQIWRGSLDGADAPGPVRRQVELVAVPGRNGAAKKPVADDTDTPALGDLMDRLLQFLPEKTGTILDVACRTGVSTRRLLDHYSPERVTGVTGSEKFLEACRATAPGASFYAMSATELEFDPGSFDAVMCLEAAYLFRTRERFLRQALEILKPGGALIASDIVVIPPLAEKLASAIGPANQLHDVESYRRLLREIGFEDIQIHDATSDYLAGRIGLHPGQRKNGDKGRRVGIVRAAGIQHYVVLFARRPFNERPDMSGEFASMADVDSGTDELESFEQGARSESSEAHQILLASAAEAPAERARRERHIKVARLMGRVVGGVGRRRRAPRDGATGDDEMFAALSEPGESNGTAATRLDGDRMERLLTRWLDRQIGDTRSDDAREPLPAASRHRAPADATLTGSLNTWYDQNMYLPLTQEFYGGSDFHNFGYWTPTTDGPHQASENLMEKLLEFIPTRTGNVVDVACGKGATTRHLLKYWKPEQVIGLNISARQLDSARVNAPESQFLMMDATALALASDSVDNLVCVEAAFHFDTRQRFLTEAHRVLRKGGRLVLSDLIPKENASWAKRIPMANQVTSIDEYRALYRRLGFEVQVVDATKECWRGYMNYALRFVRDKVAAKEVGFLAVAKLVPQLLGSMRLVRHYVLVGATKA